MTSPSALSLFSDTRFLYRHIGNTNGSPPVPLTFYLKFIMILSQSDMLDYRKIS